MRFYSRPIVMFFAILFSGYLHALPIIGSEGESIIINFDFSREISTPPYDAIDVSWVMNRIDVGDAGTIRRFFDLDATGDNFATGFWSSVGGPGLISGPLYASGWKTSNAGITDGVFSLLFTSTTGDFEISSATALALRGDQEVARVNGVVVGQLIPVPATIALFCLGLIGLGFSRHKVVKTVGSR